MEALTFIISVLLIIVAGQYGYYILSALALGVFFAFSPSWSNLFLLIIYFLSFYFLNLDMSFGLISSLILLVVLMFFKIIRKKQDSSSSGEDGLDFSKLFGGE